MIVFGRLYRMATLHVLGDLQVQDKSFTFCIQVSYFVIFLLNFMPKLLVLWHLMTSACHII